MAGGYFTKQDKIRPGAYINFETNDQSLNALDATGPVVIPLKLDWGESEEIIELSLKDDFQAITGKKIKDIIAIREAYKATGKIIIYNLNGEGAKATKTEDGFVVTAVYGGTDGNKINVIVDEGLNSEFTIKTYYDSELVDSQVVTDIADLKANSYATFSGNLPNGDAAIALSGGTTVAATNNSYTNLAEKLDTVDFKVVAIGTDDDTVKSIFTLKAKEWREEHGKNVTFVTNDYNIADFEGVVSVLNGVTLEGGEILTAEQSLYWYAAAYANSTTNSLTYTAYPGAIDCEEKSHHEIVEALENGHIVYTSNVGRIVVEQDINTFTSFTAEKNRDFSKNKLVRTMDIVSNNTQYVFSNFFIGKVTNNPDGRDLFKQQLMKVVLDPLQDEGALQYETGDIHISQGEHKDAVVVDLAVTFYDSMEKLYMTVNCQ